MTETDSHFYVVWDREDVIVVGKVADGKATAIGPPKLEWSDPEGSAHTVEFLTDGVEITREEFDKILAGWGVTTAA